MSKKKRRGDDAGIDMQISKEEVELERNGSSEPTLTGTFQRADDETLKKRVIRKAKRRLKTGGIGVSSTKSNPFANVNLLGKTNSSSAQDKAAQSNPFSGVKLSSSRSTANTTGSGTTNFGWNLESASSAAPQPDKRISFSFEKPNDTVHGQKSSFSGSFGVTDQSKGSAARESEKSEIIQPFGAQSKSFSITQAQIQGANDKENDVYLYQIAGLNKAFRNWIQKQDLKSSWDDGVSDYISYVAKLEKEKAEGQLKARENVADKKAEANTENIGNNIFGGAGQNGNTFSFTSGLFSNKGGNSSSSGLFGAPLSSNIGEQKKNEEKEEDDEENKEEAIKVETQLGDDEEKLHEVRAKVLWFRKKDESDTGSWSSKGVGQLLLLKQKSGNLRWLLMRTETTGRVAFNAPLYDGMKVEVDERGKAVTFVGISYMENKSGALEKENNGKPSLFRLKVKQLDDAKALEQAIKENITN